MTIGDFIEEEKNLVLLHQIKELQEQNNYLREHIERKEAELKEIECEFVEQYECLNQRTAYLEKELEKVNKQNEAFKIVLKEVL